MSAEPKTASAPECGPESLASTVVMVRPAAFGPNAETAASNRFQTRIAAGSQAAAAALGEFDRLADALAAAGVEVIVAADTPTPGKPDAVFPNNWLTTHADGLVVLYPMLVPSRRAERRSDLIEAFENEHGRVVTAVIDLSGWERRGRALEGTGSLVLDRRRRIAYVSRSPRTSAEPLAQWARLLGYRVLDFTATDRAGVPVYHTNVMMSVGEGFAVAALESIADPDERARVQASLEASQLEILEISREQMSGFAANLLQLATPQGPIIAMSAAAFGNLGPALVACLERHGRIVTAPIPTIERCGGGSVRCMLAEIFLPRSSA